MFAGGRKSWHWRIATANAARPNRSRGLREGKVRLLLTDVDGVLTDGRLFHFIDTQHALVELKGVDTQDGIGLSWLVESGIDTGVISGRVSAGFKARARMLHMKYVVQGTLEKVPAFEGILRRSGLKPEQVGYIGDDLPDIPVLRRVGWAVATANARPEVKRWAHHVTRARGGHGAVREAAERILRSQGFWGGIRKRYEV